MNKNKILILVLVLATLLTSSCRTSRVSQTQIQLLQYSLQKADLLGKWSVEGKAWGADYGGESYGITYMRDKYVFINHIVSIHSSEDRAKQAYKEWETKWFDVTNLQPEAPYVPLDQNDDYRFECLQIKPDDPLMDCIYLQRHNEIISFVKTNFDDRSNNNLKFAELSDILAILDKRLNELVVDATFKGDTQ